MTEQRRDAAADLAMCEAATLGPWEWEGNRYLYGHEDELVLITTINGEPLKGTKTFIAESRTALPHWINRAVAAEAEVERLRGILVNVHGALYGGYIFDPTITAQIENALNGK
jgi:hypothetical protein